MPEVEIAGTTLKYKNAAELPVKVQDALKETREQRVRLEKEIRSYAAGKDTFVSFWALTIPRPCVTFLTFLGKKSE